MTRNMKHQYLNLTAFWITTSALVLAVVSGFKTWHLSTGLDVIGGFVVTLVLLLLLNHFWTKQAIYWINPANHWSGTFLPGMLLISYLIVQGSSFFSTPLILDQTQQAGLLFAGSLALLEEYQFRGILLPKLIAAGSTSLFNRRLLAVILSSIAFGISHALLFNAESLTVIFWQFLATTGMGLVLATLYLRTHSLIWPIGLHLITDFFLLTSPQALLNVSTVPQIGVALVVEVILAIILLAWHFPQTLRKID